MILGLIYVAFLTALTVLSIRTLAILKSASPFTSAGWAFTILYDCTASAEVLTHAHAPFALAYIDLGVLIVAFVIAGVRDEAQADPWWWPRQLALTRAQRRAAGDPPAR
jgi:hypothetical protein